MRRAADGDAVRLRKQTPPNGLVNDLIGLRFPKMVARDEAIRVTALANDVKAKRITLADALAQLRGEA